MELLRDWLFITYILLLPHISKMTSSEIFKDNDMRVLIKRLLLKRLGVKSAQLAQLNSINKKILDKLNISSVVEPQKLFEKEKLLITCVSKDKNMLSFKVNNLIGKNILSATLNIEKQSITDQITIYRQKKTGSKDLKVVARLRKNEQGWITKNITKDLIKWLKKTDTYDYVLQFIGTENMTYENTAYINIECYDEGSIRRKRAKERECQKTGGCCRRTVSISITNSTWESWIFAPLPLDYHYCAGKCTGESETFYGQLMSQVSKNTSRCCVPTKLQDLRFIHSTKDHLLYETVIKDFMAADCKCRETIKEVE